VVLSSASVHCNVHNDIYVNVLILVNYYIRMVINVLYIYKCYLDTERDYQSV
jgi:hypothetical protein